MSDERNLVAAGALIAAGMSAFAGLAIFGGVAPGARVSEHLMIFARPSSRTPQEAAVAEPARNVQPNTSAADMTPVGSIGARGTLKAEAASPASYEVRGMYGSKALIKTPDGFIMADVGMSIPGIGTVTDFQYRNGKWLVVTTGGTLGQ